MNNSNIVEITLTVLPKPKPIKYAILLNRDLEFAEKFVKNNQQCMVLVFFTKTVEEVTNFEDHSLAIFPIYVGNESDINLAIEMWITPLIKGAPIEHECICDERTIGGN